ncbi:polyprenyl synthetase family protein [Psychrilyobacter sp.]|uniref:polyprenyl synthetase family protein n=1 Tax=Psychrilyobacter sp. TaxID=2586924 RepID=UPI003018EC0B
MKEYLKERRDLVDLVIEEYLNELKYPKVIAEGMKYSVLNGGKRLRPILLLMTLDLLGVQEKKGVPMGVAIELIHSYSLVHDDLPALDNDDYRRGKFSTHKKIGEAEAILIGDALLTHAFNLITREDIEPAKIVELIRLTSNYAGVNGMIGGQMVDIESEGKEIDLPTLQYIHTHKTGKLLMLPVECACIIAGSDDKKKKTLKRYAELIGLAFQIKDDILDIEGTFEEIGKPVGSDRELLKSTYPSIFGMEKTKEILDKKIEEAKKIMFTAFGDKAVWHMKLADYIGNRRK